MIEDTCEPTSSSMKTVQVNFTAAAGGLPTSLAINNPYYFQPDSTLDHKNADIRAIEVVPASFQTKFEDGVTNVAEDTLNQAILNLCDGEDKILVQIPLTSAKAIAYGGFARKLQGFKLEGIIWQKCYIELIDTTNISAGEGIKLNIYYNKKDRK